MNVFFSGHAENLRRDEPYLVEIFAFCAVGVLTVKGPAGPQRGGPSAW